MLEEKAAETPRFFFEFVHFDDVGIRIRVRLVRGQDAPEFMGFMVEVSRIGGKE